MPLTWCMSLTFLSWMIHCSAFVEVFPTLKHLRTPTSSRSCLSPFTVRYCCKIAPGAARRFFLTDFTSSSHKKADLMIIHVWHDSQSGVAFNDGYILKNITENKYI